MNKVSKNNGQEPAKKKMRLTLDAKSLEQVRGGLLCFIPPSAVSKIGD